MLHIMLPIVVSSIQGPPIVTQLGRFLKRKGKISVTLHLVAALFLRHALSSVFLFTTPAVAHVSLDHTTR
jgi:hypothetical protein